MERIIYKVVGDINPEDNHFLT